MHGSEEGSQGSALPRLSSFERGLSEAEDIEVSNQNSVDQLLCEQDKPSLNSSIISSIILNNPLKFVSLNASRDTLFRVIKKLQFQNRQLISTFQKNKHIIIKEEQDLQRYKLENVSQEERAITLEFLRDNNKKMRAEQELFQLYLNQCNQLNKFAEEKKKMLEQVKLRKLKKEEELIQKQTLIKDKNQRLVRLQQEKFRILQQIKRKKKSLKSSDTGAIDKLLAEYYENIKSVMNNQQSFDKVNQKASDTLQKLAMMKSSIIKEEDNLSQSKQSEQ